MDSSRSHPAGTTTAHIKKKTHPMNGPLAQLVALTCHGNAAINGADLAPFFPAHSTCTFCDAVAFVELKKNLFGKLKEKVVAATPDVWMAKLRGRGATAVRLHRQRQDRLGLPDRVSAGFVGGGGEWRMEVAHRDGQSEFWAARWQVWNREAAGQRIWRVAYGLVETHAAQPDTRRTPAAVATDMQAALQAIHAFAMRHNCEGFTKCFADALAALEQPGADIGYHKDLWPPGQLGGAAAGLLKAAMSAWVFGGMGSWNDMGFQGDEQREYEAVSERLFEVLNEAIEVAASSTAARGAGSGGIV